MKWEYMSKLQCSSIVAHLSLTWGQLHPRTDLVDVPRVAEEEEAEADHGAHHQQHGGAHHEHGGPERRWGDGAEVQHAAFTHELRRERVADAVVEEAEVSGLRRVDAVPDPEGLDEHHHRDDDEADGEHGPHDADGPGVPHVVGVVDLSRFLRWEQIHVSRGEKSSSKKELESDPAALRKLSLRVWLSLL